MVVNKLGLSKYVASTLFDCDSASVMLKSKNNVIFPVKLM